MKISRKDIAAAAIIVLFFGWLAWAAYDGARKDATGAEQLR